MSRPAVSIIVAGQELYDWTSFEAESNLLTPADAFSFTVPNIQGRFAEAFTPGDAVQVVIDDEVELKGYLDDVQISGSRITIAGRDVVGHLVDCSAEPRSYSKMRLDALAEKLAGDWVPIWQVDPLVTLATHSYVKVDVGETVWDVLARIARKDRCILWLDAQGVGHIGRPTYTGPLTAVLRNCTPMEGRSNVWEPDVMVTLRDRFSELTVLGSSGNTRGTWGSSALKSRTESDAEVPNSRRFIMTDGDIKTLKQAQDRAEDEVERRYFESVTLRYTAPGFYGEPLSRAQEPQRFAIDTRVAVVDTYAGLDTTFYVTARQFRCDEQGDYTTRLELHPSGVWMA